MMRKGRYTESHGEELEEHGDLEVRNSEQVLNAAPDVLSLYLQINSVVIRFPGVYLAPKQNGR